VQLVRVAKLVPKETQVQLGQLVQVASAALKDLQVQLAQRALRDF
jgi:hypothetical protein